MNLNFLLYWLGIGLDKHWDAQWLDCVFRCVFDRLSCFIQSKLDTCAWQDSLSDLCRMDTSPWIHIVPSPPRCTFACANQSDRPSDHSNHTRLKKEEGRRRWENKRNPHSCFGPCSPCSGPRSWWRCSRPPRPVWPSCRTPCSWWWAGGRRSEGAPSSPSAPSGSAAGSSCSPARCCTLRRAEKSRAGGKLERLMRKK